MVVNKKGTHHVRRIDPNGEPPKFRVALIKDIPHSAKGPPERHGAISESAIVSIRILLSELYLSKLFQDEITPASII
jgi:hypothetical protein